MLSPYKRKKRAFNIILTILFIFLLLVVLIVYIQTKSPKDIITIITPTTNIFDQLPNEPITPPPAIKEIFNIIKTI